MTVFDLVFIAFFLIGVGALAIAALLALSGHRSRALWVLRGCAIAAAFYLGIVVLVSLVEPRQTLSLGEPKCFDDWCITVDGVERESSPTEVSYLVRFRLDSRARRVSQRENGLVVYLSDDHGVRYNPVADPSATPMDVLLQPMQSVTTTRTFKLPSEAHASGLVITHEGGFPIDWFIIGGGPFRKAPIVRLDDGATS